MTFLASASPPLRGRHAPPKVLVVDDSNELVGLLSAWLEDEGYLVFAAMSGAQALDAAETHEPDVVLLDLVMAPLDGVAVCEALQHRGRPPEIILMTGISDPGRLRRVDDLGGLVMLRKPLTHELVVNAVRVALARRSLPAA